MDPPAVSHIAKLPAELLSVILGHVRLDALRSPDSAFVDRKRDLQSCSQVSKTWRSLTVPYLFRDITFSACSTLPCEAASTSDSLPAHPLPQCATLATLYNLFHALPLLCNHVRILTLKVQPGGVHWADHVSAEERNLTPYRARAAGHGQRQSRDDFTNKPTPGQLFSLLALFPNLRCLTLHDFLLDLSQISGPCDTLQPKIDLLSICFPQAHRKTAVYSRDPRTSLHNPTRERTVNYLLQCFGEIGTLHLNAYDADASFFHDDSIDEQYIWRKHHSNDNHRIPLRITELILQESQVPSTFFSDNIFVSPSIDSLRHLDMSLAYDAGDGDLQTVIETVGHQLESLRINSLELMGPHLDRAKPSRVLNLRRCTNIRSLFIRYDAVDGSLRNYIWQGLPHMLSSLPQFSNSYAPAAASTLSSVVFDMALYQSAEDAEENNYINNATLKRSIDELEDVLLALLVDSNASSEAMTNSERGQAIFLKSRRERFVEDFEGAITTMFPRLHQANLLLCPTKPVVYGGSCSLLCLCTFCIMMSRNRYS